MDKILSTAPVRYCDFMCECHENESCKVCEYYRGGDCSLEYGFKRGLEDAGKYVKNKLKDIDLAKVDNPNELVSSLLDEAAKELFNKS